MMQSLMAFLHHTYHGSTTDCLTVFLFGHKRLNVMAPHSWAYTSNTKENLQLSLETNKIFCWDQRKIITIRKVTI